MFKVFFYSIDQFHLLENDWHKLEIGHDMTYFQLYDWYKVLIGLNPKNTWAHEIVFCLVTDSVGTAKMIAPLWIVKHFFGKRDYKGAYIYGRRGWSDYCNFIYNEFCTDAIIILFQEIYRKYRIKRFVFENLKSNTSLFAFLKQNYVIHHEKTQTCVAVNVPEHKEDYLKMLSKNSKQNIRTAHNRATKDGIEYAIIEDDKSMTLEEFQHYREMRVGEKNRLTHGNIWHQIRNRLSLIVRYQFPRYTPMENDKNCHYLSCRTIKNELMGAFCYGKDLLRHEIVVMAVSLNMDYKRYSPCMLAAYHFIIEHIGDKEINVVNFTRGNEKYKYVLGGQEHYCKSFEIIIE